MKNAPASATSETSKNAGLEASNADHLANAVDVAAQTKSEDSDRPTDEESLKVKESVKATPKSWADLVRTTAPPKTAGAEIETNSTFKTVSGRPVKSRPLSEALSLYNVDEAKDDNKIAFLEPRGLVNTGNMCYMNSV